MGDEVPPHDRPMRLRMVCEDLGPTFVKLGQILSTRPDLLPEAYTTELAQLRDHVKPFPFAEVEAILAEEYGRPASEVFAAIEAEPLASASISQVHRATLRDGRMIALKVRRPGIDKTVQADLDILKNLAQLAERRMPCAGPLRPGRPGPRAGADPQARARPLDRAADDGAVPGAVRPRADRAHPRGLPRVLDRRGSWRWS